jgi:hypothetical protein
MPYATRPSNETNNLRETYGNGPAPQDLVTDHMPVRLANPELVKIERLRLIGWTRDFPQWDLSYCIGVMADGTHRRVDLGRDRFGTQYKAQLIECARNAGRYAKGMGLLDDYVISLLAG